MDNRIPAKWSKAVTMRYYSDLYAVACNALKEAGKQYMVDQMHEQFKQAKSPRDSLDIMQRYVRFEH